MRQENFWNDRKKSEQIINECNELKKQLQDVEDIKKQINDEIETCELLKLEPSDTWFEKVKNNYENIQKQLEEARIKVLLNGPHDKSDAILEIHSGAGGTEACDWASMLDRMYERWCDKHKYQTEVVDV